jgi:hypothetical protein
VPSLECLLEQEYHEYTDAIQEGAHQHMNDRGTSLDPASDRNILED